MAMEQADIKFGLSQVDKAMALVWNNIQIIGDNCGPEIQGPYQEFIKQFHELENHIDEIAIAIGAKSWEEVE